MMRPLFEVLRCLSVTSWLVILFLLTGASYFRSVLRLGDQILGAGVSAAVVAVIGLFLFGRWAQAQRREVPQVWRNASIVLLAGALLALSLPIPEESIHLVKYGTLSFLVGRDLYRAGHSSLLWGWGIATGVGALDEGIQYFLPTRVADARDLLLNAAGAALGVFLLRAGLPRR